MGDNDFLPDRLTSLISLLKTEKISPLEAIQRQFNQLELDQSLHCIIKKFDQNDKPKGPFAGTCLIHKDIFSTPHRQAGFGNTYGLFDETAQNAKVLKQLESAGIQNMGALTMAPYACGATSQNPNFPRCINPIDPALAVGGSSSGSAVAVASHITYVSLGTDTSGSVRIPSATCGITGLKTTRDLISLEGVCPLAKTLDTVGLLGRYAEDIDCILDIVSQYQLVNFEDNTIEKVSYWLPQELISPEVKTLIEQFLSQLNISQAIDITEFEELKNAADIVMAYEIYEQYQAQINADECPMGLKAVGKLAKRISTEQYQDVITQQTTRLEKFLADYFSNTDLIVLPCVGSSIPLWTEVEIGHPNFSREKYLALFQFMGFINLLGLPSISFPIGDDSHGRPVSVQVIAKPFHEKLLLKFANTVEKQLFNGNCYLNQK